MKNSKIKLFKLIFATALFVLLSTTILSTVIFAASGDNGNGGVTGDNGPAPVKETSTDPIPTLKNPLKSQYWSIEGVLFGIVDLAIFIGTIVAVLMFIYIGFQFVMAKGNETKLKDAKQWFLYAVIGTAILISSKVIVSVVQNTLISAGVVNEKVFKP